MKDKISCYLASPWFNSQQMRVMNKVRDIILKYEDIKLFAPYYDGIVLDKKNDSIEMRQKVFDIDIGAIAYSDLVVTIIDDFDPGSIFEMGAAGIICWMFDKGLIEYDIHTRNIPRIIAYSDVSGRGLNVMLQQSIWGFANGEIELRDQLGRFVTGVKAFDYLGFVHGDFV
jgi:nucleoside 2-deoxyribosyltransferase